jgi:hypothetical protein
VRKHEEAPGKGGFSIDLCPRNALLEEHGARMPQFRKTGTTIVGLVFQVLDIIQILLFLPLFPLGDPETVTAQIVSEEKAKTE